MKLKILLLHGAMGSKDQWTSLKDKFLPHAEVFAFNFSGHGTDTTQTEFSIELFVYDTLTFLSKHRIDVVNIFGYSMGGYVALAFAKDYPDRVNKIMTLGTKFDWTPQSAAHDVSRMKPEIIDDKIPKFAEELRQRHHPNDWRKIMKKTTDMMTDLGNGKAMKRKDFEIIPTPTMIGIGNEDKMVSLEESTAVANMLVHGQLHVFPGFKHPLETNDVEVLAEILLNFLR